MTDIDKALVHLKNNRARDHDGYVNEIFKKEVIGKDLKKSLFHMFNRLKLARMIAVIMSDSNITLVHKRGYLN